MIATYAFQRATTIPWKEDSRTKIPLQGLRICNVLWILAFVLFKPFSTLLLQESFTLVTQTDMDRIFHLGREVDKFVAKITTCSSSRQKHRYRRACMRLRRRLVTEVHCQLAKSLAATYDVIKIPLFEVSKIVKRSKRRIQSTTARSIMTWGHYRFRQGLIHKARQCGRKVVVVDESFTSKTCSSCGFIKSNLGASKVFRCDQCKCVMDRDANGAKNIFVK